MTITAAITGAAGFIGAELVRACLEQGYQVRVLSRQTPSAPMGSGVTYFVGDLQSTTDWASFLEGADVLIHAAAELQHPASMQAINVDGPCRLLAAAQTAGLKQWVQLSSVGAYGPVDTGEVTEVSPENPIGPYEKTKTDFDAILRKATLGNGLSHTIIRPSIVYGPGMRNQSLKQMMMLLRKGWFVFIGPKGASANYVHVDDVVQAVMLSVSSSAAANQTFIVSDWATMEDMVAGMVNGLHADSPQVRAPLWLATCAAKCLSWLPQWPLSLNRVKVLTNQCRYSTAKIEQELGWSVSMPVQLGMKRLAEQVKF